MKKILSLFLLIITMFSVFTFSSCSNKYVELEVPVERYEIINDGGSFGTTVIQFYVTDDFEYDLDLLKDIKVKFSYRPEKSLSSKTVTEEGKVDSFIGADDSYFYVNIKNRVATNIENPVEVLSVNAKIEKRFVNNDSIIKPEKEPLFGIGMTFLIGLIVSVLGIGASYIGMQVIEDEMGKIVHGAGILLPIVVTIFTYIVVGIWQGVILTLFNIAQLVLWFLVIGRN